MCAYKLSCVLTCLCAHDVVSHVHIHVHTHVNACTWTCLSILYLVTDLKDQNSSSVCIMCHFHKTICTFCSFNLCPMRSVGFLDICELTRYKYK